jgi:hypothetical protein
MSRFSFAGVQRRSSSPPIMSDVVPLPGLAVVSSPAAVNGSTVDHRDGRARVFYDRFLTLSNDILAGRHPTIKTAPSAPVVSPLAPSSRQPPPQPASPKPVKQPVPKTVQPLVAAWAEKKHQDAVREDARIKRQQLERELQSLNAEQVDDEPFDNLDEILAKAQVMLPGVQPKRTKTPSNESFDENSYYSSKANSWSSDSKEKGDDAESEAMAISSDAGGSEVDFEPHLEPSFEAPKHVADAAETSWSNETPPDAMIESEDNDYSPPAVPSPDYLMSLDSQRQSPQPQAISLNHIKSPLAPQPEYISPLAQGAMQNLDRSNEPSRSEHERQSNSWRGKKGRQSRRNSPPGRIGKGYIHNPKKRRRQEVEEEQRKRRPRSQSPYIKQEEVTPPPLRTHQTHGKRPSGNQQRTPSSGKARQPQPAQVTVPAGYKLVPIDEPSDYAPTAYETYQQPAMMPAPMPRPRPVLVDQHGNEFYAEPPPQPAPMGYEVVPVRRVTPTYYERPVRTASAYYEPVEYAAAAAPPPPEAHYAVAPQPLMAPPPQPRAATVQAQHRYIERPATVEPLPPPPERAYSLRPTYPAETRTEPQLVLPHLQLPLGIPLIPPPPPQFLQQLQQQQHQLQQQQQQYRPPQPQARQDQRQQQAMSAGRAYSVVPQVHSPAQQAYRHASAAPPQGPGMGPSRRGMHQQQQQQQQQQRAVSVYPARYVERGEEDDYVPRGPRRGVSGRM